MPSPFPGMDPYLESPTFWSDFHATFINTLSETLNDRLSQNHVARIDRHETMFSSVLEAPPESCVVSTAVASVHGRAGVPAPVTMRGIEFVGYRSETYIRVLRLPDQALVTVLLLMSPTSKYGDGRSEYMHTRKTIQQHSVNLVELDLLRAGVRIEFSRPLPAGHYFAFVSRASVAGLTDAHPWSVRSRMPTIPIPLRSPGQEVLIDLAEPFTTAYDRARYWKQIDYSKPPPSPAFAPEDAEWVAQTARAGVRAS